MGKSGRVRLVDLTGTRLIHDCRDVGHDPAAWPAVLGEGKIRLIDCPLVLVGQVVLGRAAAESQHGGPRLGDAADRKVGTAVTSSRVTIAGSRRSPDSWPSPGG